MNTPAHLLLGAALFARPGDRARTWGALAGGLAPDLSLYVMAGVSIGLLGISPQRVFRDLYYSVAWQSVFAIDNSAILWAAALALACWTARGWAVAACGSALVHLAFDFPLHGHDARMHFWPLTDWRFVSPFSYWEGRSGRIWGLVESAAALAIALRLAVRFRAPGWRALFGALVLAQLAPALIWATML